VSNASYNNGSTIVESLIAESRSGAPLMKSTILSSVKPSEMDVNKLIDTVNAHQDHSAYHVLFLLHRLFPDAYRNLPSAVKAPVLCDALSHLTFFNDWGYLAPDESHDGEAAQALLELGKAALPCLTPLLDESRAAPLFGSETATMSTTYRYRINDFAYRYISKILGRQPNFAADPQARDSDIERLKTELQSQQPKSP